MRVGNVTVPLSKNIELELEQGKKVESTNSNEIQNYIAKKTKTKTKTKKTRVI